MSTTPSPTPWTARLNEIYDANDVLVACTEYGGPRKGERPTAANTAHILACVNAVPNIKSSLTDALEQFDADCDGERLADTIQVLLRRIP